MRDLVFDPVTFEDLGWWIEKDRKQALRVIKLIEAVQRDPFRGIGQPEPLKHELAGCWSRHIDREHRLVYKSRKAKSKSWHADITIELRYPQLAKTRRIRGTRRVVLCLPLDKLVRLRIIRLVTNLELNP